MRDAVIVEAVRTPIGKRNGSLSSLHAADLGAKTLEALAERTGIDVSTIDDVVWGCVSQIGEQTGDVARTTVLSAGWPESVPGVTVDRQCGSSQQAVHFAAAGLIAGQYDLVVAGGVESMSRVPMGSPSLPDSRPWGPAFFKRYGPDEPNQGVGAEMVASKWNLSRNQLDEFALRSHAKAAHASDNGLFEREIVTVDLDGGSFSADEGIRRGGTPETMAKLKPAFSEDGVITAGNSSQISDGSAALLMTTSENAAKLGLRPLVRIHTATTVGSDPIIMLTGPIPATEKVLRRSGLSMSDIGAIEISEAFAPVVLAWMLETGFSPDIVNPNGGAIALGHPLGASGARLMTTLVHHMVANGIKYGLQTMCEGGGQANATILELVG
jgi:acetyl-CoA acyltransferase